MNKDNENLKKEIDLLEKRVYSIENFLEEIFSDIAETVLIWDKKEKMEEEEECKS